MSGRPLTELNTVPWQKLQHAYGAATDVQDTLRSLATLDERKMEKALYDLHGNIWHQGTVYEATAHAVPFLIGLASDEKVLCRDRILLLIAAIASGTDPSGAAGFADAARRAVQSGVLEYIRLCRDKVQSVALASAYLLGVLDFDVVTMAMLVGGSPLERVLEEAEDLSNQEDE